jgi:hypothetical protein
MSPQMKEIHIGEMLFCAVTEKSIHEERICKFFGYTASQISAMYTCKSIDTILLLKWSKLLEYDFFRIYSQHLIFYSPSTKIISKSNSYQSLPKFRKNIYTNEAINFFLELIATGEKTIPQVLQEYGVPKSTMYRWLSKRESPDKR